MGVGLLRSFLGGGSPQVPEYLRKSYQLENQIRQAGLDLYNNTNLEASDSEALGAYSRTAMDAAMKMAGNYDARAAAMGSPMGKSDTRKDRARAQTFADSAGRIGEYEANLATTRAQRKAALLPGASPGALMQGAQGLDAANAGRYAQDSQGWADASRLIYGLFPQGGSSGRNDRTGGTLGNSSMLPWDPTLGNDPWNVLGMPRRGVVGG